MAESTAEADAIDAAEVAGSAGAASDTGRAPSRSGTLAVGIIGLLVMILTPLTSYFIVKLSVPARTEAEAPAPAANDSKTVIFSLESMLVNIAETKGTRILRFVPHLVLSEPALAAELELMKPMLADRITAVASSKTIDELDGLQGRELLKKDVLAAINALIEDKLAGAVVDVYFGEFLIQ